MRQHGRRGRIIAMLTAAGLAGGLLLLSGSAANAEAETTKVSLTASSCLIYANYRPKQDSVPKQGPVHDGNERSITKHDHPTVDWRYNPDSEYALVKVSEKTGHSQWWFIQQSCLLHPPKQVDWDPVHPSGAQHTKYVCSPYGFIYVRDDQHRVIGRLYNGQTFVKYGSSHHGGDGWDAVGYANGFVEQPGRILEPKVGTILRPTKQCTHDTATTA